MSLVDDRVSNTFPVHHGADPHALCFEVTVHTDMRKKAFVVIPLVILMFEKQISVPTLELLYYHYIFLAYSITAHMHMQLQDPIAKTLLIQRIMSHIEKKSWIKYGYFFFNSRIILTDCSLALGYQESI